MKNTALVITSIANESHPVLNQYAIESAQHEVPFIVVGDTKSPNSFNLKGCDFYSLQRQQTLGFELAKTLPAKHYSRKNIGYLVAMKNGAEVIVETDDDNLPMGGFWDERSRFCNGHHLRNNGWTNIFKYFTEKHIWPRGFALEKILEPVSPLPEPTQIDCPIQQGLADGNPDVDAIYRLTSPLPIVFNQSNRIAAGTGTICPFNSQNTTWFKEAFPLLYLPSYCSFRMTDIWRSFIAQRIAWTCGWSILFHKSTVYQQRNDHNLMNDFKDEIPGYTNNLQIANSLEELSLRDGKEYISSNMMKCYRKLIEMGVVGQEEADLLCVWRKDFERAIGFV